jgi:hypothetical protein
MGRRRHARRKSFWRIKKTTGQGFREGAYLVDRRQWLNQAPMPERPVVLPPAVREVTVSSMLRYHHWICHSCGHEWIASLRVPS